MNKLVFCRICKPVSFLVLLLLIPILFTGCYLLETVNQTPIPTDTAVPAVNLEMLPTLPTLVPEEPTETPVPPSNIYFETNSSIFSRMTSEQLPAGVNQVARFTGIVLETDSSQYKVEHSSGVEFMVNCDDFCFYVLTETNISGKVGKVPGWPFLVSQGPKIIRSQCGCNREIFRPLMSACINKRIEYILILSNIKKTN